MNRDQLLAAMREMLNDFKPSRELSLAKTKLDEFEMWLGQCEYSKEGTTRDLTPLPSWSITCPACGVDARQVGEAIEHHTTPGGAACVASGWTVKYGEQR